MGDNDSNTMFAGGVIVVIIVIMACLKAIQKIFTELGLMFKAFGKMAESFLHMAWHGVLALGLIATGLGCLFAAGYFTYKYYVMVKRGTEIQKAVNDKVQSFYEHINSTFETHQRDNDERLHAMALKLKEALDKPAIAPTQSTSDLLPEVEKTLPESVLLSDPILDLSSAVQNLSPQNVDNPF